MRFSPHALARLVILACASTALIIASACGTALAGSTEPPDPSPSAPPSVVPTAGPTSTPYPTLTPPPLPTIPAGAQDYFILSLDDNGYAHLFAYAPGSLPLLRLTNGNWDDTAPALSPDGTQIAFASRRNGYQDLYILDLQTGDTTRLTDTPEYDSHPSWSPDGQWIAYETYRDDNLDIAIRSTVDPQQPVVYLTDDMAADHSPAWSPEGRQIAFVSTRNGDSDVWLANLDQPGAGRFVDLSNNPTSSEAAPAWSPDGRWLAWASSGSDNAFSGIYSLDITQPGMPAHWLASGDSPAWGSSGNLAARLATTNSNALSAYGLSGNPAFAPIPFASEIYGMDWRAFRLPDPLPPSIQQAATAGTAPLYVPTRTGGESLPAGRVDTVPLEDVQAPYPELHDDVDEAFTALRDRVIQETHWDALASLENAFIPITTALDPGLGQDWLYTGRAFSLNPLPMGAGWMLVAREDIEGQTYWRLYLRPQAQDGSEGEPLHALPWDLDARYNLDPASYDQGGQLMTSVPPGYWVDFTALARRYGWERLPALPNWRSFVRGARFNEFALTSGLTWHEAMLQLYPVDIFITPTGVVPATRTPTRTPLFYRSPTPTLSPTPRPTFTPSP